LNLDAFEGLKKAQELQEQQGNMVTKSIHTRDSIFIRRMIKSYSRDNLYVLDVFTGGVVVSEGLKLRRKSIAIVFNEVEKVALETEFNSIIDADHTLADWAGLGKHVQTPLALEGITNDSALDSICGLSNLIPSREENSMEKEGNIVDVFEEVEDDEQIEDDKHVEDVEDGEDVEDDDIVDKIVRDNVIQSEEHVSLEGVM